MLTNKVNKLIHGQLKHDIRISKLISTFLTAAQLYQYILKFEFQPEKNNIFLRYGILSVYLYIGSGCKLKAWNLTRRLINVRLLRLKINGSLFNISRKRGDQLKTVLCCSTLKVQNEEMLNTFRNKSTIYLSSRLDQYLLSFV